MRRRRGFLLLELIVGAILLGTILSVTLRFVVALGASQRAIGYREAAMREAANAMEKLWTMDWEKLSDERGADLLSEESARDHPRLGNPTPCRRAGRTARGEARAGRSAMEREGRRAEQLGAAGSLALPHAPARRGEETMIDSRPAPRRRGFSLIEMLAVLAVGSVLMAVAAGLLHTLMAIQQSGYHQFKDRRALDRLARQFREDVHAATAIEPQADGKNSPGWKLPLGTNLSVEYRVAPDGVHRIELEAKRTVRRELYELAEGSHVDMSLGGDKRLATLRVIARQPAESQAAAAAGASKQSAAQGDSSTGAAIGPAVRNNAVRIDAVLGLDHRFAPGKGAKP